MALHFAYIFCTIQHPEADILKNIVISVQNGLLSGAIEAALQQSGSFRCRQFPPNRAQELMPTCRAIRPEVLLMEVSRLPWATLEKRLESGEQVRRLLPDCRIALLCDEVADPDLAEQVMHARRFGRIDAFFYASVTANYLIAALEAL